MAVDLATAMQTIAKGQAALMDKIDHLQTNLDFIRRVAEVEQRVSATEVQCGSTLETCIH